MKKHTSALTRILGLALVALMFCTICAVEATDAPEAMDPEPNPAPEAEATTSTPPAPEPDPEPIIVWQDLGTFELTAYCSCESCCGYWATIRPKDENGNPIVYTASGAVAEAGTTIAVDPRVIPYGTEVRINGHTYIAQDTGGAIKGSRIDVYFDDHREALVFGRQKARVYIKTEAFQICNEQADHHEMPY